MISPYRLLCRDASPSRRANSLAVVALAGLLGGSAPAYAQATGIDLPDLPELSFSVSRIITPVTLPIATGDGDPVYSLIGPNESALAKAVPGLNFDAGSRSLLGVPQAVVDMVELTYRSVVAEVTVDGVVTVPGSTAESTFTVSVTKNDDAFLPEIVDRTYTVDVPIDNLTLPAAAGATRYLLFDATGVVVYGPLNDGIIPNAPAPGLTYAGGVISGTPSAAGAFVLTYYALDFPAQQYSHEHSHEHRHEHGHQISHDHSHQPSPQSIHQHEHQHGIQLRRLFTLVVETKFPVIADKTYAAGAAIAVTLPAVIGDRGDPKYALAGDGMSLDAVLPGLMFDSASRVLSAAAGAVTTATATASDGIPLTYTAEDAGVTTTSTFRVRITGPVFAEDAVPLAQTYPAGTAIVALTLPKAASAAGPVTYTLLGTDADATPLDGTPQSAVPGLVFDASTQALTGTPTTIGSTTLVYTATDKHGNSTTTSFAVEIRRAFSSEVMAISGPAGTMESQTLPSATGGGAPVYALLGPQGTRLEPKLPVGLAFDADTRLLSGQLHTAGSVMLTYRVYEKADDATAEATLETEIKVTVVAPMFVAAPQNRQYLVDVEVSPVPLPAATADPENPPASGDFSYEVVLADDDGNTPLHQAVPGLSFAAVAAERRITGTPTTPGVTTLLYRATDPYNNEVEAPFTINVTTLSFENQPMDGSFAAGDSVNLTLPTADSEAGGEAPIYMLTGPEIPDLAPGEVLPGLSFDPDNRILAGTPTAAGESTLTYTATTATSSVMATFSIAVSGPMFADTPLLPNGEKIYDTATTKPITLALPEAMGYTPLIYALTLSDGTKVGNGDDAWRGLSFNSDTQVLTGRPTHGTDTMLTYRATDAGGNTVTKKFPFKVLGLRFINPEEATRTYPAGKTIAEWTLPSFAGHNARLSDLGVGKNSVDGAVPGLRVDISVRKDDASIYNFAAPYVISGRPRHAGIHAVTYEIISIKDDEILEQIDTIFTLTISGPSFATSLDAQSYTIDVEIDALALPQASGGYPAGDYIYAISGTVPGLSFNSDARLLTGTPTASGVFTLEYSATDPGRNVVTTPVVIAVDAPGFVTSLSAQNYTAGVEIEALILPLVDGSYTPYTYALSGAEDAVDATLSAVAPGLSFNSDSTMRILTGTPTAAGAVTLIYRATDPSGNVSTAPLEIYVDGPSFDTSPEAQNYTAGTKIEALTLPLVTGGYPAANYAYAISGADDAALSVAVPGLVFDDDSRVLSGTPTAGAAALMLSYRATDPGGNAASEEFAITIAGPIFDGAPSDQEYAVDVDIGELILPLAAGDGVTYDLLGSDNEAVADAVPGLVFDAATQVLSGTPSAAADLTMTYRATGAAGASETYFRVAVTAGLSFADTKLAYSYPVGAAIDPPTTLPQAMGGAGVVTYALAYSDGVAVSASVDSSSAVPGLIFDPDSRLLSGTPSGVDTVGALGDIDLDYTATDAQGNAVTADIVVTITGPVFPQLPLVDRTFNPGQAFNFIDGVVIDREVYALAEASGAEPITYALVYTPNVVLYGLNFHESSRQLRGFAGRAGGADVTYTATDTHGNASAAAEFRIIVTAPSFPAPPVAQSYTAGIANPSPLILPEASDVFGGSRYALGGADGDTLAATLPGLVFDADTREISGAPAAAGMYTLAYGVTDGYGNTASAEFIVTVADSMFATPVPGAQNYVAGQAIAAPPTFPLAPPADGDAPFTYTLTGPGGATLAATLPGLEFDPSSRILAGTPSRAGGAVMLTYTVTDAAGRVWSAEITVTVAGPIFASPPPGDQRYTIHTAITPLTLPAAADALSYTLFGAAGTADSPNLPPGLRFNQSDRILRGTPTATGGYPLTYTAHAASGVSSIVFEVTVDGMVAFATPPVAQRYVVGGSIYLTLPPAVATTGTPLYTLTTADNTPLASALPGLSFDAESQILSSEELTAAGRTGLVYTASVGADSATAAFDIEVAGVLPYLRNRRYTVGVAINSLTTLPQARGDGDDAVYTVVGAGEMAVAESAPGLAFDAENRVLSGTPQHAVSSKTPLILTYRSHTDGVAADERYFRLRINPLLPMIADYTFDAGVEIPSDKEIVLPLLVVAVGGEDLLNGSGDLFGARAPGLIFGSNGDFYRISGTPTTAGAFTHTYDAYNIPGYPNFYAQRKFTIFITRNLPPVESQNYAAGEAIDSLTFMEATGGTPMYSVTGPDGVALSEAAPGLSFDPITRTLSGTPTTAGVFMLTYVVADDADGATGAGAVESKSPFTVTITGPVFAQQPADQTFVVDEMLTALALPSASGNGMVSYDLAGANGDTLDVAVPGLVFNNDADSRELSGQPTAAAAAVTLVYTATDDDGTATVTFDVTIHVALAFPAGQPADQEFAAGTALTVADGNAVTLPAVTGNIGADDDVVYALVEISDTTDKDTDPAVNNLPTGLNFDPATRILTGTPEYADEATLAYTATDGTFSTLTAEFTITITDNLRFSPPQSDISRIASTSSTAHGLGLQRARGGTAPISYTLTGAGGEPLADILPGATLISNSGGIFLSTLLTRVGTFALKYTATDAADATVVANFNVVIDHDVVAHQVLDFLSVQGNITANIDQNLDEQLPAAGISAFYFLIGAGGEDLQDALPQAAAAFDDNSDARRLTATPTRAGAYPLRYRIQLGNGIHRDSTFTVNVPGPTLAASPPLVDMAYEIGDMVDVTLPAGVGVGPFAYTVTGPDGQALDEAAPGLVFNDAAASRVLSGPPTSASRSILTYTAADKYQNRATATFMVSVGTLMLPAIADQSFAAGTAVALTLPPIAAAGLSYALEGTLPAGLSFADRVLSGTPTTAADAVTLTYIASEGDDEIGRQVFTVTITSPPPAFPPTVGIGATPDTDVINLYYPVGEAITQTTLPLVANIPTPAADRFLEYEAVDSAGDYQSSPGGLSLGGGVRHNSVNPSRAVYLAGTPSAGNVGSHAFTYRLTNYANGFTSPQVVDFLTFNLSICEAGNTHAVPAGNVPCTGAVTGTIPDIEPQTYTTADTVAFTLPQAIGTDPEATLTYALTGDSGVAVGSVLPGLSFDADGRALAGTPTTATTAPVSLTYTASDSAEIVAMAIFEVTVTIAVPEPAFPAAVDIGATPLTNVINLYYKAGTSITPLTLPLVDNIPTDIDPGNLVYELVNSAGSPDPAPGGVNFNHRDDPDSVVLSGTTNASSSDTIALTYRLIELDFDTSQVTQVFASLDFNITICAADNTNAVPAGNVPCADLVSIPDIEPQTYTTADTVAFTLPQAIDADADATLIYALTGDSGVAVGSVLPGLSFDVANRALAGTPTTATTAPVSLTYAASDSAEIVAMAIFEVTVTIAVPEPAFPAAVDIGATPLTNVINLYYKAGTLITPLTLPLVDNIPTDIDPGNLVYELVNSAGSPDSAPGGVNFNHRRNPDSVVLSGTTNASSSDTIALTYRLIELDLGTFQVTQVFASLDFNITICEADNTNAVPAGNVPCADLVSIPDIEPQTYTTADTVAFTLPEAIDADADATLIYALTGADGVMVASVLPGLSFELAGRALAGMPTTVTTDPVPLTYTAIDGPTTDGSDEVARTIFTVTISASPVTGFPSPVGVGATPDSDVINLYYKADTEITRLELPLIDNPPANINAPGVEYVLLNAQGNTESAPGGLNFVDMHISSFSNNNPPSVSLQGTPTLPGSHVFTYRLAEYNFAGDEVQIFDTLTLNLTICAADDADADNDTGAEVCTPPVTIPAIPRQNYTAGVAATLFLPLASGDDGTMLSYKMVGNAESAVRDVVPGMSFDADNRVLQGQPTTAASDTLTYRAIDGSNSDGSDNVVATAEFDVVVRHAFPPPPAEQAYRVGVLIDELTLPQAVGGGALIYALSGPGEAATAPNLPAGLSFDATEQVLSGTPSTPAAVTLLYTASDGPLTDGTDEVARLEFMVSITQDAFPADQLPELTLAAGTALTEADGNAITLPETIGGGDLTYALINAHASTDDLPPGLTFTAAERILSGTPTTAATTTLNYTASQTNAGITTQVAAGQFVVTITGPVFAQQPADQTFVVDEMLTALALPSASGNGTVSYALAGENGDSLADAVPGLSFNPAADSRELSGQPTAVAPAVTLVYTATDDDGSATATFEVTIADGLIFPADQPADLTLPAGTALTVADSNAVTLPAVTGNIGADDDVVYALVETSDTTDKDTDPAVDNLPTGLSFDPATRVLTGTPQYVDEATLSYTATDGGFSTLMADFTITITGPAITSPGDKTYPVDSAIATLILPAATGMATPLTYSLVGPSGNADTVDTLDDNLPDGLVFDPAAAARTLTGEPTAIAATLLDYTVTDRFGNTATVMFTVSVTRLAFVGGAPGDETFAAGTALTVADSNAVTLPAVTGNIGADDDVIYALVETGDTTDKDTDPAVDNLPTGLSFDPATRVLTGTPEFVDVATLVYTATDGGFSTLTADFTITITGPAITSPGDKTYPVDSAIATLILPAATGMATPLTYSLVGPGGDADTVDTSDDNLPDGLVFDPAAASRELSGTPSTVASAVTLTYRVTDRFGNTATVMFTVSVTRLAFVGGAPGDETFAAGTALTVAAGNAVTLPAVTGNIGADDDVVYALVEISDTTDKDTDPAVDNLPTGLNFDAATRILTGTPEFVDVATLSYTATDGGFSTLTADFTVTITGPAITSPGDKTYPVDSAIATLILPAATGMATPLTYSLVGPGGDADTVDTSDDNLPDGLVFDPAADSRELSGTPSMVAAAVTLTYRVTDRFGNVATVMFTVSVTRLAFVGGAPGDETFAAGTALTVAAGNAVTLPAVTGNIGADDDVVYALVETSDTTDKDTDPAVDNLPTGLSFDPATRVLTGTPQYVDEATLSYTATDGGFSTLTAEFTVTITGPSITSPGDKTYPVDSAIATLILPAATGMATPLIYSLIGADGDASTVDTSDDNLPDGLVFDPAADSRELSGTPSTVASAVTLTYRVTDRFGNTATVMFTVSVTRLAFVGGAPGDETFAAGTALTVADSNAVTLPAVTGNIGADDDVVYALVETGDTTDKDTDLAVDNLPTGLSFDPATRVLTGTPQYVDEATLSYTATDGGFSTLTAEFAVTITGPSITSPGEQSFDAGDAMTTLILPAATGMATPLVYSLVGAGGNGDTVDTSDDNLPPGLVFDADSATRTLTGTPSTVAEAVDLTYRVTDRFGNTAFVEFAVTITGPSITARGDREYGAGSPIERLTLPAATGMAAPLTYSLIGADGNATTADTSDDNLPPGLIFDPAADSRELSGTPSTVADAVDLTYRVTDRFGNTAFVEFAVTITGPVFADLTSLTGRTYAVNQPIAMLVLPTATGNGVVSYTLAGENGDSLADSVPGLSFNPAADSRELSGQPTAVAPAVTLVYTATDTDGSATATFEVTIADGLIFPADQPADLTLPAGTALTVAAGNAVTLPAVTGNIGADDDVVYALVEISDTTERDTDPATGNLPTGLSFDPATRVLTGTPQYVDEATLSYTATDGGFSTLTAEFTVTITGPSITSPGEQSFAAGDAMTTLILPAATGMATPLTYSLIGLDGDATTADVTDDNLPPGLVFDADSATRTLTGTPNTVAEAVDLTYRVTDRFGNTAFVEFAVTITGPSITARGDREYGAGSPIERLILPAATGMAAPLIYSLIGADGDASTVDTSDDNLPDGLVFDPAADSRELSGTPSTVAAAVDLTYRVTDRFGNTAFVEFTVTITGPVFAADLTSFTGRTYAVNQPIAMLTLPTATGNGGISYALAGENGDSLAVAVPGLSFNPAADSRELSGQPTAVAPAVTLVYTATDTDGSATATFEVTITDGLIFPADQPADLTLPAGTALTVAAGNAVTLPAVTGNIGDDDDVVYALVEISDTTERDTDPATDNLPTGLAFDPATRVLTGTPQYVDEATLSYTATDGGFSTLTAEFTITITGPSITSPGDKTYPVDSAIATLILPAATGMATPLTYSLVGPSGNADTVDTLDDNLPDGLVFDPAAAARTLTGEPTAIAATLLDYTVTDRFGNVATVMFTVSVTRLAFVGGAPGDETFAAGTALTVADSNAVTLPAVTGNIGADDDVVYALVEISDTTDKDTDPAVDNLPTGLTFDPATRVLTGTPQYVDEATLSYTATDGGFSTLTAEFTVTITGPRFADFNVGEQSYSAGMSIDDLPLPEATDGFGAFTYTLAGPDGETVAELFTGLSFDGAAASRTLSGTPSVAGQVMLTYIATDESDNATDGTAIFMVTVHHVLPAPVSQSFSAGSVVSLALPAAIGGGAAFVYGLTAAAGSVFPAGLVFTDTATARVLSGVPTTVTTSPVTLVYTADRGSGDDAISLTATFEVTITAAADETFDIDDQEYAAGTALTADTSLTLPQIAIPEPEVRYALDGTYGATGDALPGGFSFDENSRVLSGEPTVAGAFPVTYTARRSGVLIASGDFTITVTHVLETPGDETYAVGGAVNLTLPTALGDPDGVLVYALNNADADTDDLPAGLLFAAGARVLSGTPSAAGVFSLAYTASRAETDGGAGGIIATMQFVVTITGPRFVNFEEDVSDRNYPAGEMIDNLTLPVATDGFGAFTYTLTGPDGETVAELFTGLSFDGAADSRILSGTPTAAAAVTLTYIATDSATPPNATDGTATFVVSVGQREFARTIPPQSYPAGDSIEPLTLPAIVGGGDLTYAVTGPGNAAVGDAVPGLAFDADSRILSGVPRAEAAAVTLTYTAGPAGIDDIQVATVQFTVTISAHVFTEQEIATAVNMVVLPEVTRAIAGNVTAAITQRIGRAGAGSVGPSISLGGQGSVAGVLGAHGQAMAEDSRATKALLAGSEFTLPLNASGDGGGAASTTLWGSGEYRKMSGTGDGLDWDGELSGFHIGVDTRPRPGLLLGLSVSKLRSEVDYSGDLDGGIGTSAGRQDLDLTSLHPYLGWRAGTLDLWASLGYGEGNIAIDPHDSARVSGDVDMRAVGFGGSGALWAGGGGALRLRGEISGSRLQVARNADLDALEISTMRVRLAAEASHRRTLVGGGVFEPAVELGLRQDSGDGAGSAAAEFGARMGYSNAATGYRAEGSFRAVLAPSEYEEWGVHGSVSFAAGADGQGLSLLISPAYGQIASGIEKLWQHGLPAADNAAADDYRARLEAHLGYGLPLKNHGVLTPYGELTVGASRRHRLGLNWRPSRHFELNLLGERRQSSDGPAENAVLIKGEARF